MRAVSLLLVLAAAAAAAVSTTASPPALLVLRAACRARDPAALERVAAAARHARVLSYRDTCGPGWSAAVTRESLATMSAGGEVALLGWPGATTCDALSAVARAIGAPPLPACALQSARAAAVAQLVMRSGWRRCVIPPAPLRSECRAAQLEVTKALRTAAVHTAAHSDDTALSHHVVILCASRQRGVVAATGDGAGVVARAAAVLLLHVEEPEAAFASPAAGPMGDGPSHAVNQINPAERLIDAGTFQRQLGSILKFNTSSRRKRGAVGDSSYFQTSKESNENSFGTKENYSDPVRRRRHDYLFSYIDDSLPRRELLVLSADELDGERLPRDIRQLYDEAIDTVRSARGARSRTVDLTFYVYRRTGEAWSRVGSVMTASTPALDDAPEWVTKLHEGNASETLVWFGDSQHGEDNETAGSAGLAALSAGAAGGVVLAVVVALAVRWAAARQRRRRRGGDAVLSPADFSFPADEQRCVGDGMETMLSCWLQRLHEFGGPELDRPDLLKRPVPLSAPSSTCSVNRIALDRRIRYKGDAVHVKPLGAECSEAGLDLKRKAVDVLLLMQTLRHENLNPFIGYMCSARAGAGPALVWDHCGRGSLEDVLMADDIKLDWTFRLSMLTDLVKGMRYLHASPLRVHGHLSSRNCVVDSRWVLRVTDYGTPALARAHQVSLAPPPTARDLLWTAPELLRDTAACARGSQPGDVYSFAIIMQEVIVRGEPYCMLALLPDEIVEKLRRPPPLIRPSVSMGAAPPEAVSVMRQCWSEAPDLRPDFHRLHDLFRQLHRGRKVNIVDSMFEMLEKYSNNLEELIKDRTEQLDMEKKKTEQLLNRMLPRSVAERLLMGSRVEPEEFAEVSIYFSDIVGFTALAARSTPVQVVDLLNDLYTTFDAAIERYDVYKVETIGDAYMVVGGLPARTRDHAQSVATMALHLLHLAGRFRVRHLPDTPLHLRIGLHSGPCCAAVVGLTMPRYCLFGDTVNTASRMESTGAAWRIQVSAATAERLAESGGYRLRSRGLVMIKGKGAMHTYWLLGKDGFDKPLPAPPSLPSEEVLFETDGESECEMPVEPPACTPASPPASNLAAPGALLDHCHGGARRSGAVSADSSPPDPSVLSALPAERATHARYRRAAANSASAGSLRRQWSLERGEALASALAERAPPASAPRPTLLVAEGTSRAPPPRYRTRPETRDDPP